MAPTAQRLHGSTAQLDNSNGSDGSDGFNTQQLRHSTARRLDSSMTPAAPTASMLDSSDTRWLDGSDAGLLNGSMAPTA
jgi:hypothetical protein